MAGAEVTITLSVYSGCPNPEWSIAGGVDYEKLIHLISTLKINREPLFKYDGWNRLGYASFWITPKNVNELPYAIHVWRDMAFLIEDINGDKKYYSLGATKIYDLLVAQAEDRGYGAFFENYHKNHRPNV